MAFAPQLVQGSRLPGDHCVKLHAEYRQHRQQFACAKLGRSSALETREQFRRDASLMRYVALFEPQRVAACSNGAAEFLQGLHLMFTSTIGQ